MTWLVRGPRNGSAGPAGSRYGSRMISRFGYLVVGVALTLSLVGCSSNSKSTTFTLQQASPHIESIPIKGSGHSMGDLVAFVASITRDSKPAGTISGTLTTVDLPGDGIGEETLESRVSTIVMRFNATDCLTLTGSAVYPSTAAEMNQNTPQIRAITGGTGAYVGARGQVTTTRNSDGSYTHLVELLS